MSPRNRHFRPALLLAAVALALTGACADPVLAGDPIPLTNVVCLVYGEEVENETPRIGHVFVREDFDGSFRLCFGDGDTPGGILLARLDDLYPYADPYNLTNTVRFNGNILQLGPHYAIRAPRGSLAITYDSIPALRIVAATNAAGGPALSYAYDSASRIVTLSADFAPGADTTLVVSTNLLDASSWVPCTNAVVSHPDPVTIQWQISSTNILGGASVYYFAIDSDAVSAGAIHADLPIVAEQGLNIGGELRTGWPNLSALSNSVAALDTTAIAFDGRVGELEERAEEYWCKWTASSMSASEINWIPTNWPARTVHCIAVFADSGTTNIIALPDWSPDEPHTLNLYMYKAAAGSGILQSADGTAVASATGGSANYSRIIVSYVPGVGWLVVRNTINQPVFIVGGKRLYPTVVALPEDGTFAPVTEPAASLLSLSPSQSPSLSAGHLEDLDSLDTLDEPNEFEPAAEAVE